MSLSISIRELSSLDDLEQVAAMQVSVWGGAPIPIHQTRTAVKNGGLILGAFDAKKMVGFLYGFPGFDGKSVYLCSHQLGVDPQYQGQGIGSRLKLAQESYALEKGYALIRWTYDPLESRNAYLNMGKLGAVCFDYVENCYGEMKDDFNRGLPSDRFWVHWYIGPKRQMIAQKVQQYMSSKSRIEVLHVSTDSNGFPRLVGTPQVPAAENTVLEVPIPSHFQSMKQRDAGLALEWRLKCRHVFEQLFATGWVVAGVQRDTRPNLYHYLVMPQRSLDVDAHNPTPNI